MPIRKLKLFLPATTCLSLFLLINPGSQGGVRFGDFGEPSPLSNLPLLTGADIFGRNLGGFRLPSGNSNGSSLEFSPTAIAYRADTGTLYVASHSQRVAEISIPAPVLSNSPTEMNTATYIQGLYDPIEGRNDEADGGNEPGSSLSALLVYDGRLYGTNTMDYDANNTQRKSHWSRPLSLSATGDVLGLDQYWDGEGTGLTPAMQGFAGFVSGYLFKIPSEWQATLGGYKVGTGQCCQSIISRNSYGPAAFGIDLSRIGSESTQPHRAKPYLYYPNNHTSLGGWDDVNPYFGITTTVKGAAIINNTRTLIFLGRQGETNCYGIGVSDPLLHKTFNNDTPPSLLCYDPTESSKGQHGYPYYYFAWLYDLLDIKAVAEGIAKPWQALPYAGYKLTFPISATVNGVKNISGVDYDAKNKLLYVSQQLADQDGFGYRGIIWRFAVDDKSSGAALPPPAPQPSTYTISGPVLFRYLSVGVRGNDVESLQNFLISNGFLANGLNTGYFGLLTRAAVRSFQCAKQIVCSGTEVTTGYGMVGPKTRAAIGL